MKNTIKFIALAMVAVVICMAFAGCSNISQSYADKVNKAAEKDEHYTLEEVRDALGDEAVEILFLNSGVVVAVKGCSSLDEIEDRIDDGKAVKGIIVTVVAGKATGAKYTEITEDDLK